MKAINKYSENLILEDNIWKSDRITKINYPIDGNATFFEVEDNSFWYVHRKKIILYALRNFGFHDETVFDIGGGNGYVGKFLQDNGFNVILCEPDIRGVLHARHRGLQNTICATIEEAKFKNNSLENVCFFDVLEHIENDAEYLRKVFELLQPKGKVCITVPAYQLLSSMEDVHDGHFRRYSLKNLVKKVERAGFTIDYSTYFFCYIPLTMFLFKTIPSRLKLGKFKSLENYKKKQKVDNYKNEHEVTNFFVKNIINLFHKCELKLVNNKVKIPFGGSIIIVASKK